jgi:hypothetical protein
MDIDDNECKSCDALWELIMKLTAERDSLRQQLAEQTSSIDKAAYDGAREDLSIWKKRALEAEAKVSKYDQRIVDIGVIAMTPVKSGGSVEVLLEALRTLIEKCDESDGCQYGTLGTDFVRHIANDALNAYSAKPQNPVSVHTDSDSN